VILVCSLRDLPRYRRIHFDIHGLRPEIYCTAVGSGYGMARYENLSFFNPTWGIVRGVKDGTISQEEYRRVYQSILNANGRRCHEFVRSLRQDRDYILLCFCREGEFCHRHTIADKIARYRPDLTIVRH
jgi:hypothetical protein